jgi:flagellar biosynthesis GTPase FlhF
MSSTSDPTPRFPSLQPRAELSRQGPHGLHVVDDQQAQERDAVKAQRAEERQAAKAQRAQQRQAAKAQRIQRREAKVQEREAAKAQRQAEREARAAAERAAREARASAERAAREALEAKFAAAKESGGYREFKALAVQLVGEEVYSVVRSPRQSQLLGMRAGAQAVVEATTSHVPIVTGKGGKKHWGLAAVATVATGGLAAPIAIPAGMYKTKGKTSTTITEVSNGQAMVGFTDGTVHSVALSGMTQIQAAQREAMSFNTLTAALETEPGDARP